MHLSPLLASVAIDVDVTALIMAVGFMAFYFVLQPIIVNPYLRARELRRDAVEGAREEAKESGDRAEATMLELEEEMRTARRDAAEVRESLRTLGTEEQNDIIEEARIQIQGELAAERDVIAAQTADAEKELRQRATGLSQAMVDKILPAMA